jgi:heme-degrading monooxygenase HmoA
VFARVTQLEIDTLRVSVDESLALFEAEVLPQLRLQPGYQGVTVLTTNSGSGMLISLWDTAEHAQADADSGFYADVLSQYVTLFKSPPGRERYEVRLVDAPDPERAR